MKSRFQWFLLFFLVFILSGCAHVISKDLRTKSDPSLTLNQIRQNPETFKGNGSRWRDYRDNQPKRWHHTDRGLPETSGLEGRT
jgi:uncharacterized protein YceK